MAHSKHMNWLYFLTCSSVILLSIQLSVSANNGEVNVNLEAPVWIVSEKFLSVTIDANSVRYRQWENVNFTTPRMLSLARALSPAVLRVGGTSQDYLIFENDQEYQQLHTAVNFTMSTADFDAINGFAKAAGWDLVFGLNVLLRDGESWSSANAKELLLYTKSKGYPVSWELGNEPDLFDRVNISYKPEQLAKDLQVLHSLLEEVGLMPEYLAGPDVATLTHLGFFTNFLTVVKPGLLDAITWHHYYESSANATLSDMYNPAILDRLIGLAETASNKTSRYLKGTELWLGETSSCYGGGAKQLSGSYVSGFMWLDKLGIIARTNHSRIFRQDYIGGAYSLLDSSFNPLPDYWLSVLYKRLVGRGVLDVAHSLGTGRKLRVYAHCAKGYSPGDVVLLILNTQPQKGSAVLKQKALAEAERDVYWLTPPDNNLLSLQVALNGKVLALMNNATLPDLPPLEAPPTDTIQLPAHSFGFIVFKNVNAKACIHQNSRTD